MHDHRVHADLPHQHDISGERFHRLVVAHGVATEFDHHDGVVIPLQIGQRFGEGAGG